MTELDDRLVAAIQRGALGDEARRVLASEATPGAMQRAAGALATCRRIATEMAAESDRLGTLFAAAGIAARPAAAADLSQRHELTFRTSREDAQRAAAVLEQDGFHRHPEWTGGADRSFWATSTEVALTRTTSWTTVVRLRWDATVPPGRLARAFRPRPADWDVARLPRSLWWAYGVVRPVRLVLDRAGLLRRDHGALEPFLSTPTSLIEPLLGLAGVTSDDFVADIGCGDGRIVVGAVQTTACRAVGVEYSPSLVAAARRAVDRAGLGHRVRILEGDGRALDVAEVTVVLLFLPMGVAVRLVPDLLARLPVGARLVLHEQSPLDERLPAPGSSVPIVSDDAVTVAHLWRVECRDLGDAASATTV